MRTEFGQAAVSLDIAASKRRRPLPDSLSPQLKRHNDLQNSGPAATIVSRCWRCPPKISRYVLCVTENEGTYSRMSKSASSAMDLILPVSFFSSQAAQFLKNRELSGG